MIQRRSVCLSLAAVLLIAVSACNRSQPVGENEASESPVATATSDAATSDRGDVSVGTVTIEIESDEEVLTLKIDGVREGETVESVMRRIEQVPITIHGKGPTAFVDQIGERATNRSEGWTYRVDGEFAMQGIGQLELSPPTTIRSTVRPARPSSSIRNPTA